jgi:uncharacterized membrane-anchored protein
MRDVTAQEALAPGAAALVAGRREDARAAFDDAVGRGETADGPFRCHVVAASRR